VRGPGSTLRLAIGEHSLNGPIEETDPFPHDALRRKVEGRILSLETFEHACTEEIDGARELYQLASPL